MRRGRRHDASDALGWLRRLPRQFLSGLAVGTAVGVLGALVGVGWFGEDPLEAGDLVIFSGRDDSKTGVRKELIEIWNSFHPENQAKILELPALADVQYSGMLGLAQAQREVAGPGPHGIDIYNLDVTWTAKFASEGFLREIDESQLPDHYLDAFIPVALRTCEYDGSLWALPFNTDAGLVFYWSDLVQTPALKDPETQPRFDWQLISDWSRQLPRLRAQRPELTAGYVGQFQLYEGVAVNGMEALWAGGVEQIIDESANRVRFDREKWERALARLAFAPPGAPGAGVLPGRDPLSYDETRSRTAFQARQVLFMRNWPVQYRYLVADSDTETVQWVKLALLPGPSALGGQNLAVSRYSEQPKAAQELIEFLTNEVNQRRLFRDGGFAPTREKTYTDATVDALNPYAAIVRKAVGEARPRPSTPHYVEFSAEFQLGVQYAMAHGGSLPEDFETKLNQRLQGD